MTVTAERPPLVLAVSGASAQPLAERALKWLLDADETVDLVTSRGAMAVWQAELGLRLPGEPDAQERFWRERTGSQGGLLRIHRWNDQAASIASGSYRTRGMVILPASMGCVGRIAAGVATDLLERAADVHLKEARPLVICPRETPWNLIHLRNLTRLAEAGARIAPPVPAWYHQPQTIEDMVDFLVVRIFDVLGDELAPLNRWSGPR
ncbi:MAG: UbiX family flavin prenyltransferase [Cyanobacteria bacterium M_surface_7_m2_040]|nr:UbiX family flavin prenyltransferase [Cyanobacteria bacterium K_Offshore_0m_m2_072]MBM5808409.1 UbiX family flavin prenyltransferase [Cyanobacteria bacterium M_surface_9_m1_291]MBM5828847.1 UbiX family flavin prenyltransferase [Cyanobacteria bacterium M_surface_7_m2_040]